MESIGPYPVILAVPSNESEDFTGFVKNTAERLHLEYVLINREEKYRSVNDHYINQRYLIWISSDDQELEDVTIYKGIGGLEEQVKESFERYGYSAKISHKIIKDEPNLSDWIENNINELSELNCFHLGLKKTDDKVREVLKEILYLSEDKADNELVEKAYEYVTSTVKTQFSKTMYEVGGYLLKTFYNDNWRRVHENKPVKDKSFNQLLDQVAQGDDDSPSKAWLYNAVKIVADEKFFIESGYEEYKKLGLSQKVKIARIKGLESKKDIAKKALENNLTVNDLNELILKVEPKKSIAAAHKIHYLKDLKKLPPRRLTGMLKRVDDNIGNLKEKIQELNTDLKVAKENQKKLNKVLQSKPNSGK